MSKRAECVFTRHLTINLSLNISSGLDFSIIAITARHPYLMARLHWRGLYAKMPAIFDAILPSLLALAIRNISIWVASPKVAKASTIVTVSCQCRWHFCLKISPMETQL